MDRPHVTIHNMESVDGRLTGFPADQGLFYETAAQLPQQAVLCGSATLIGGAAGAGVDLTAPDTAPDTAQRDAPSGDGSSPWLVVVDGGGRITRLGWLRTQPHWRDVLVLCHESTPDTHLELLRRNGIGHFVGGAGRVDLAVALGWLAAEHGVRDVRVDAGGTLNGVLLRAGLVDELSVIVAPYVVGDGPVSLFRDDAYGESAQRGLNLTSATPLRDDHVWLRYRVS
ncbi:MAG TPA: RibD family protein [Candidatus Limnocylindrales bacterium]